MNSPPSSPRLLPPTPSPSPPFLSPPQSPSSPRLLSSPPPSLPLLSSGRNQEVESEVDRDIQNDSPVPSTSSGSRRIQSEVERDIDDREESNLPIRTSVTFIPVAQTSHGLLTINYNCPIELFENADVEDVTRRITIHLNNLCESDGQDLDISVGISANYSVIKFYYDYSGNSNKYVQ